MSVLEIFVTIYVIISYLIVGYVILSEEEPYSPINIAFVAVSPILFPILIVIAIKLWYNDKKFNEQVKFEDTDEDYNE